MTTTLTGRVVRPGDPDYEDARMNTNARFSKYPAAIVFCGHIEDVANAVRWARKNGYPLRVRSGRHCYEDFTLADGGIVIDVSPMNGVRLDPEKRTAVVQTGIRQLPLYETLWQEGVTVPGGTCPTVGIAGLTLGGGYGFLSRMLGLTCDQLLEVETVLANGQVIRANDRKHADLLWASRGGGGGNFGIATSFTFRVYPVSNVAIYRIVWPWRDLPLLLNAWQHWAPSVDERLTPSLVLSASSNDYCYSSGQYVGPERRLRELLAPVLAVGTPLETEIMTVPYLEAMYRFGGLKKEHAQWQMTPEHRHRFKNSGAFVYRPLPPQAISTIASFLHAAPSPLCMIVFESLGGHLGRIPPHATAFVHRRASFHMQYITQWDDPAADEAHLRWAEGIRKALLPYTFGQYVNYPNVFDPNWSQAYYGSNLNALRRIKRKYDPDNVFRFAQSIPPL
ncbi:FAD-binding oxidoreductase [Paenibacillus tyrfis]|uniref:FAD-binding oxidoreductase n=1 Tax=Paenibacillus tyrfis TaxID=1501230 RepID=UPI000B5880B5|nr:FAD-binding oxidoreductase [Paenibacillus tyrfis]